MPTTGNYKGTIFRLYVGGTAFVDAVNCTFSMDTEMIDKSTKDTAGGGWKGQEPGEKSATFTTETLIKTSGNSGKYILDKQIAGTSFDIVMMNDVTGDWSIAGTAYCSQSQITAQNKEFVRGQFTFVVDGAVTSALEAS
jgi:hypothetical protein